MSDEIKQNIESGDSSTNIQAENVTISGFNYEQVKDIALLVFKDNFTKLSDVAQQVAIGRAIEFTENYLKTLLERNPISIENLKDPGVQSALYSAQSEYAKHGDKSLFDVLTDLLVDRTIENQRGLMQIVLEESIQVVSKLTGSQLDTLTTVFLIKLVSFNEVNSLDELKLILGKGFAPFFENLSIEPSLYQHLEYCRCCSIAYNTSIMIHSNAVSYYFSNIFKKFFSKGFTGAELKNVFGSLPTPIDNILISNLYDKSKLQLPFENSMQLNNYLESCDFDFLTKNKIKDLFDLNQFTPEELKSYLVNLDSRFENIYHVWNHTFMRDINLTSVGISLAQANYRSKTGENFDLSLWIK